MSHQPKIEFTFSETAMDCEVTYSLDANQLVVALRSLLKTTTKLLGKNMTQEIIAREMDSLEQVETNYTLQ